MEIIVADGRSTDRTREIIEKIINKSQNCKVKLIDNPKRIFSTGFNAGLRLARGKVIFMLGGHTEIAPDYVRRCVVYLSKENIDCVGGCIETVGENKISRIISAAMGFSFGVGNVAFRTGSKFLKEVDTVAFGAYKTSAIKKFGFIDEEMIKNQDDEYNYRIREQGAKIFIAPDVRCRYYSRSSIGSLWQQYFRYGFWKVRVFQKHPGQMRIRHFVPPAFVGTILITSILALFINKAQMFLIFTIISYLIANVLASIICAVKKGWEHFAILPIIFATLHISYGSGFLLGLIRFANRWRKNHSPHTQ